MKVNKLKGVMAEMGYSGDKLARSIGMNVDTFYRKMRTGKFGIDEAEKIAAVLEIADPAAIFFGKDVTC